MVLYLRKVQQRLRHIYTHLNSMKDVTFNQVCKVFNTLESISSRNDMTAILADFYKNLNKKDSQIISYLILGRVVPFFVSKEFNYSEKSFVSLLEGIVKMNGLDESVSKKRNELGDIGDTLEYFSKNLEYESKELSLQRVYEVLWDIVKTTGTGSVDQKNRVIASVLNEFSPLEAKYFSRIVCGSLRFGVNSKTLLDVFSVVVQGDKGMRDELDRAYGAYADIGYICSLVVESSKKDVLKSLNKVRIEPGVPVLSRLVERVATFEEVFERLGDTVLVQSKYDGLRCQIHKYKRGELGHKESVWLKHMDSKDNHSLFNVVENDYEVRLFTRNLEDVTDMFPEVVESARSIGSDSFILDSEVLGWNFKIEKFLTFQETMQRRRKYDVKGMRESIPVKAMVFDILYLNGDDLSQMDTEKRIDILNAFDTTGSIDKDKTIEVKSVEELYEVFNKTVAKGHEGVIVKQKKGSYLPGVRNYEWIKLKKSMESKLVDSIDLVVVGYSFGSGRRSSFGVGAILGALYNEDSNSFEAICKVGTGFSDDQLKSVFKSLEGDVVSKKPNNVVVEKNLLPDVWVVPKVVFTVEADEISKKMGSRFLSLRFPRLIEWGRDKGVTEATSVKEMESMYEKQKKVEKR